MKKFGQEGFSFAEVLLIILVIGAIGLIVFVRSPVLRARRIMQHYSYDNGLGTKFDLNFYKGSTVIPKEQLKVPERTQAGNVIIQSADEDVRLFLIIGKKSSVDISTKKFCTTPAFTYKQKADGREQPVCIAASDEKTNKTIVYFTQYGSAGSYNLITIAQDYDRGRATTDKDFADLVLKQVDLSKHQQELVYALSSLEEK